MQDGKLPSEMLPPTQPPPPDVPPRFCGGFGQSGFGGVVTGPAPIAPPMIAGSPGGFAGSGMGAAGDGGFEDDGGVAGGPDTSCASVPIGFWKFDDCNPSRTDLGDSSFEGHTAFRNVDLTCAAGKQGFAASFTRTDDIVYVPDQPAYAFDLGMTIAAWVRPDSITGVSTVFRKSDEEDSAFALLIHNRKFEFVVRLTSGRLASVSAPATAGSWTHVAATYDGMTLRLYLSGIEVARTVAPGVLTRGAGPLLMGNDGTGRRFRGRIDNAWFNTQAAPLATIQQLLCLRRDPSATVTPMIGPSVPAGTKVNFTLAVTSLEDANCPVASFSTFFSQQQGEFTFEPSFANISLAAGTTFKLDVAVTSGDELEAGNYPIDFFVSSNDGGGFFGPGIVSGPGSVTVVSSTGQAGSGVVGPAEEPEPIPPPPNGFVQVEAQYVVAEPAGCHVSAARELMIRDVSVVEDPVRTSLSGAGSNPNTGVWSFGGLMQRLSPTAADAADNTEAMFRTFLATPTVNTFLVPSRPPMDSLVLSAWPRTADGKLDLARAPMRLLAITHRLDLEDVANGKAGEGRFTFGVLDPMGFQMQFTVIFEYALVAKNAEESRAWADAVHSLQALPFPSAEYNDALQVLTDRFSGRNALPGAPNGSALIDIRTNEIALSLDGQWQLREFRIDPQSGAMAPHPLFQTPDRSFNDQAALGRFINQNEAIILSERHEVPLLFEDVAFEAGAVFNNIDFWNAPGITNPEARHKFSLNTCSGCHGAETQTGFLQINPREPGQQSFLSGFLTGETVFDPVTGEQRQFNELGRRRGLLESIVCAGQP